MDFVEGPTLADRQGPMPLDEDILLALQIAEAVEAAHEKGLSKATTFQTLPLIRRRFGHAH
jgi:hypothetical protein